MSEPIDTEEWPPVFPMDSDDYSDADLLRAFCDGDWHQLGPVTAARVHAIADQLDAALAARPVPVPAPCVCPPDECWIGPGLTRVEAGCRAGRAGESPTAVPVPAAPTAEPPSKPHSRACGLYPHPHGTLCAVDCPSCAHRRPAPAAPDPDTTP